MSKKTFKTIARGKNPEEAFIRAKYSGLNGREIQEKENFQFFNLECFGERPVIEAKEKIRKIADPKKTAGCILIAENLENHPPGTNGYLFFGYR